MFGDKFFEQGSDFVEVDVLKIVFSQSGVRQLNFLSFEVLNVLNGAGDESRN